MRRMLRRRAAQCVFGLLVRPLRIILTTLKRGFKYQYFPRKKIFINFRPNHLRHLPFHDIQDG